MARLFIATLLLAAAAAGCRPPPPPRGAPPVAAGAELLGCYALFSGNGRPLDGSFYNASPMVRLDATRWIEPWARRDDLRLMVRLDGDGRPIGGVVGRLPIVPPVWRYEPATDSLALSFHDGFSGVTLSLHAPPGARDTLRGTIDDNWDFGPPYTRPRGSGYAVRVPCARDAR